MNKAAFLHRINSPFKMWLYLLWKLPSAWFMGIRVLSCDSEQASVLLPYSWRSQNPFRSIYFAAQCAAGELSTGLLGLAAIQDCPPVSMLVIRVEAEFKKKAAAPLTFTCTAGSQVTDTIRQALETSSAQTIRMESTGRLPDGTEAAKIWITWSFKRKTQAS
ncbi:MAG: DUF4442 domain-containing protein [Bacteroidetes bacterium]|nr:MAG: DUF4442 domain-containing protein [Bacteroidota bacterium]